MYVYVCICMYVYVCICMYVCMYVCICMYVYVCMYVCICMYVCMYVCVSAKWSKTAGHRAIKLGIPTKLSPGNVSKLY